MTVSSETNRWDYTGNGVLTTYPFTTEIYVATDLKVYVAGTLKTLNTHYTIDAASIENPDGGNVVFTAGNIPALSAAIAIVLELPVTQLVDYREGDAFPAETHERALDRIIKLIQNLVQRFRHMPKLPDSSTIDLVMPNPSADNYIGWNATATNLENKEAPVTVTGTQYEVDALVSYGGGTAYTKATIDSALTAIGTVNAHTLLLRPGTWVINADADYSAYKNVNFKTPSGCVFSVDALMTLTLPSHDHLLVQPSQNIFSGDGSVVFGKGGTVYPDWWTKNATPGTTDMYAAVVAAEASLQSYGGIVEFITGAYAHSADITFSSNVRLSFARNSSLWPANTKTATIYSANNIEANPWQPIFLGNGTVAFSADGGEVYLKWWATLAKAITAIGTTKLSLIMNNAETLTAAHATNANTTLVWQNSAYKITIGAGGSMAINGPVVAPDNIQIFAPSSLAQTAAISSTAKQGRVSARWWGATGDNTTDDTLGIDCAIYSANTAIATLIFPPGIYRAVPGSIATIINCPVYGPQACLKAHTLTAGNLIEVNYQAFYSTFEMQGIIGYNITNAYYMDPTYAIAVAATGIYIRSSYYGRFNIPRISGFNIALHLDSLTDDTHIASNKFEIGDIRHNNYGVLLLGGENYIPEANNFYINFMCDNRQVSIQISDDPTPAAPYPVGINYFFIHELAPHLGVDSQTGIYLSGDKVEKNVFRVLSCLAPSGTGLLIYTIDGAHDNIFDIAYPNDWSKISMDAGNVFIGSSTVGVPGTNQIARSYIWAAAAPTAGYWRKGDVCWNSGAAAGGSPGWICTTAGTPGTWNAMANVAA